VPVLEVLINDRWPVTPTSTRTASPARSAASASSTDHTPRSAAKWLNVPAFKLQSRRGAVVLQARLNLITADPLRLSAAVKFIEAEARPVAESLPGSLGMSLYANPELAVAILESFWASREALVQSGEMVAPRRGAAGAARRGNGRR
jgi:hypothetical protein